jgi:putrescine importer
LHYLVQPAGACVCARAFLIGVGRFFSELVFTFLNLQGIKTSARVNTAAGGRNGCGGGNILYGGGALYYGPSSRWRILLYSPLLRSRELWNTKAVLGGTSIAVLSYIGFDGISTLSEEAENPRRNILLATVLTCLCSDRDTFGPRGVRRPIDLARDSEPFPNSDTAFTFVAGRAWAPLFAIVGFTLLMANFRLGDGCADRRGAPALRHGAERGPAEEILSAPSTQSGTCRATTFCLSAHCALAGAFLLPALQALDGHHWL